MTAAPLAEHFFRHEYGRLVAMLCRRVGARHLQAVEDAVQAALLAGLESWTAGGPPDNPSAWLYRVAHNRLIGELRQSARRERLALEHGASWTEAAADPPSTWLLADVQDGMLRMLFACCDASIPVESQLVLALKTLCGFDVREIAERLFMSEAHVYKRLARARSRLRESPGLPDDLADGAFSSRLAAVQAILYLMFTEGYLSSRADGAIRHELCSEAKRLAQLLAEHPLGATPESYALLALMHLHAARVKGRLDDAGGLLLLEEQDRDRWDRQEIVLGLSWLARSARGETLSRYHAEAGIAAEHALAPTLAATRWVRIVECYQHLERLASSGIHRLGHALALAQWKGPAEGLALLAGFAPHPSLAESYLWFAALADLHRRCGHGEEAGRYRGLAVDAAPSHAIRAALMRRLR